MTIREMHYDFKKKFNKIDSQVNRNLLVPEIDWALNEAEQLFVALIAYPRLKNTFGFEINQRSVDDIRTVVVSDATATLTAGVINLPADYQHHIRSYVNINKAGCPGDKKARLYIKQHDDEFEESYFDKSSYEWREVNGTFVSTGIKCYTDGTFTISNASLTYIKKRTYMHNAQDFGAGTYNTLSGTPLSGFVNCGLPEPTHREIVDIAVMIAAGEIQTSDLQARMNKLKINQII